MLWGRRGLCALACLCQRASFGDGGLRPPCAEPGLPVLAGWGASWSRSEAAIVRCWVAAAAWRELASGIPERCFVPPHGGGGVVDGLATLEVSCLPVLGRAVPWGFGGPWCSGWRPRDRNRDHFPQGSKRNAAGTTGRTGGEGWLVRGRLFALYPCSMAPWAGCRQDPCD
jgi:hypothetical protein